MKRISLSSPNLNPTFIGSWIIEPPSLSDDLINYFESNIDKQITGLAGKRLNKNIKDSIDIMIKPKEITLPGNEIFINYFDKLFECYKDYIAIWSFLGDKASKLEIGSFNIQRYKPGQHFKQIHTERNSISSLHRLFAFMTYLNDVEEGGSTYFSHYDLDVKPQKGLTLLWPAEWTHAHRGNILKNGSKYIITGWINFSV